MKAVFIKVKEVITTVLNLLSVCLRKLISKVAFVSYNVNITKLTLTQADPPGKAILKVRTVYVHFSQVFTFCNEVNKKIIFMLLLIWYNLTIVI